MSTEEHHSGIPTRAIHEAYLDMQRSLKAYREAKDQQSQEGMGRAHGELQQGVLTFYELLRPHLRQESSVNDWWEGKLPSYNMNGTPPDPGDGRGILQVQEARRVEQLNGQIDEDVNEFTTLKEWHDALNLNGNVRLSGIAGQGDNVVVTVQQYQKGLKHLDNWETKYTRSVEKGSGFMSDKRETKMERQRIPIDRLTNAARELADAADKLEFLSPTGTPTNEDTRPI